MSNTYAQIQTRTSSDPNASNDINQLQSNFNSFLDSAGNFTRGGGTNQIPFSLNGNAYVDTSIQQIVFGTATTISNWIIYSSAAPDATLSLDINKNGTSIFGATAFEITAGNNTTSVNQSVTFAKFDRLSWDIDSVGTNTVGGNPLMVTGVQ
jgi:hypothetical protein